MAMPQPANGGNLEDCITNIISLTELNGIKWRCYHVGQHVMRSSMRIQDDPIMEAYGKCLKENILCTWRRKPLSVSPATLPLPSLSDDNDKELWVFWFNEKPEILDELLSKLTADTTGEEETTPPMSYDVRILYFKSLHVVIERPLLQLGWIRFGRWFTQPIRSFPRQSLAKYPQYNIACNFQFFVYGEKIVCMTINAQRQPTLIRINKMHVNCGRRVPVLLAPWSLKGTLLPHAEKANMRMDEHKEYKEWNKFIPLEISQLEGDLQTDEDMPRMVAVEIDSIRMFYPSCLICVTLDEDGLCHSVNNPSDILPNPIPSELIVQETHAPLSMNPMPPRIVISKRNKLLTAGLRSLPHTNAVLASTLVGIRSQNHAPQTPQFSMTPNDDEFRWNFNFPRRQVERCNCRLCISLPKTPGGEALWSSKGLAQVTRYAVNQQNSIQRPYHERARKNKKSGSGVNRVEPISSSLQSDCMSDDEKEESVVDWATCQTGDLQTGMYCSADEAMVYHYDPNNPTLPLKDDGETFVCSPFTPVRTISPCVNCTWPAASANQMVSSVFNEIFWENDDTQQLPPHTSLERKAAAADYYYNPTLPSLWEQPHYAPYHNRRQNEKRRANYPPTIRFDELSPEEPGSQETIPATTSPLPEDDARRIAEREPSLLMDSIRNAKRAAAGGVPKAKRRRIAKRKKQRDSKELNWPNIEDLDIEDISHDTEEDFLCKVHFDTGRDSPDSEHSEPVSPVAEEPPQNADCEEDIDDGGEGCSSISGGDMIVPMDVDEAPASTQPADSILSPPASNETPEQGNHHWNRVGTPSVGENANYTTWQPRLAQADAHSMNQIYPTPPSVQSEAQQFSPASVPPPQQTVAAHMPLCSQLYQTENDEVTEPVVEPANAQEEEELSEEELPLLPINDPVKFFIDKKGPIAGILQKIERRPIHGVRENVRLPIIARFSSKHRLSGKGAAVLPRPLDYQKMISRSEKNSSPNVLSTEHQRFFDESIIVTFPDERMPGTPTQLQAMAMQYNFRPPFVTQLSTSMAPPTPQPIHHPGLPPNHPMQSQFMHPQMQMRMGPMGVQTPPHTAFGPPHGYMHNQGMQGMYAMQLGAANQMGHYGGMQTPQNLNSQMQPPLYPSSIPMRSANFHQNGSMVPQFARQPSVVDLTGPVPSPSTGNAPFQHNQHQQTAPQFPVSHHTPQTMHMVQSSSMHQRRELLPEGSSIVLALVLSDTILDLHFDTVFDACPICSCHTSIRARELGMYITPPEILRQPADQQLIGPWSGFAQQEASAPCTCGFSAVRHRYLSVCSGLFPEDAREATALDSAALSHVPCIQLDSAALVPAVNISWFNPENDIHLNIVNQIRILSQTHNWGKAVHHLASLTEQMSKALKPQEAISSDTGGNAEYIVSLVDQTELLLLGNAAMELVTINMLGSRRNTNPSPNFLTYFHPWGLQIANEIREPSVSEWKYLLDNILNSVDKSMKAVRCAGNQEMGKIVEGPLTWRQFVVKNQKTTKDGGAAEEELFMQEPIPYILASTDKDAIRIAPQAVQMWENLSLGPYDQPKDVLYVAVTVDCKEAADNTKTYLENISQLYERMRLGRHIACPAGECRDGILKSVSNPTKNKFTASPHTIDFQDMAKYVDNKNFMIKLKNFVQSMEESLAQLLLEDERLFDRTYFRELLALDWRAKRNASAALAASAEKKYYERENQKPEEMGTSSHQPLTPLQPQLNSAPQLTSAVPIGSPTCLQQLIEQPSTLLPQIGSSTQMLPPQQSARDDSAAAIEPEDIPTDDYPALPHVIVIYVVNPFTFGHEFRHPMMMRLSMLAITRAFNAVCSRLPLSRRIQLQLEIVGIEQMGDLIRPFPDYANDPKIPFDLHCRPFSNRHHVKGCDMSDSYRATCLSVYTHPRVLSPDAIRRVQARCMTRFGPGSWMLDSLDALMNMDKNMLFKMPSNAICLAPGPILYQKDDEKIVQICQEEQILYVSYCLIGGDWLCATVTDGLGRMTDSCIINTKPKVDGKPYRNKTQILDAMGRLWTYILSVLSMETRNWRLVIGRLGRMGHGEFRAWTHLLNKASLRRYSARLKEICTACNQMPSSACTPAIVSACLVTTEAEPNLRIFHDLVEQEAAQEKSKIRKLSTPYDVSVTHIMTYQVGVELILENQEQTGQADEEWFDINIEDPEMDNIINDIGTSTGPQPSAGFRQGGPPTFFPEQSQDITAENQPLASGYYISTAPAGDLPEWFWANCPSARRRTPVHLKASLHINVPEVQKGDDIGLTKDKTEAKDKNELSSEKHPLDSAKTDEVLRHVLETYNALSWLNVNVSTGERVSCLPTHIQHLTRLYHTVARFLF